MARIRGLLRFHSIRSQVTAIFTVFIVLFAVCIAGALYAVLSGYIIDSQKAENEAYAYRVSSNIDATLTELQALMSNTVYNETVTSSLADYPSLPPYQQLQRFTQVQNLIKGAVLDKQEVVGAYVYGENVYFYFEKCPPVDRNSEQLRRLDRHLTENKIVGTYFSGLYRPDYLNPIVEDEVFSVVMPVVHVGNKAARRVGVMAVNVDASFFARATEQESPAGRYRVAILDEAGALIYSTDGDTTAPEVAETLAGGTFLGGDAIHSVEHSRVNGWKYIVSSDLSVLNRSLRFTQLLLVLMILAGIAVTVLIAALVTSWATRSVGDLVAYMGRVRRGDLHAPMRARSSCAEIDQLRVGLGDMMARINTLIEENYLRRIREQEAKLESLQSQTSPHFLNNTLQMITSLSILGRNSDIEAVSAKLADLLSYVTYAPGTVLLGQELEYIRNYVDILNVRYDGKFLLTERLPAAYLDMQISKLLLQPLVENSVLHGFAKKEADCRLTIEIRPEDGTICFIVSDNGVGIDPDALAELNGALSGGGAAPGAQSIGLRNISERLRIIYGEDSRMRIESEPGLGTRVIIRIPRDNETGRAPAAQQDGGDPDAECGSGG